MLNLNVMIGDLRSFHVCSCDTCIASTATAIDEQGKVGQLDAFTKGADIFNRLVEISNEVKKTKKFFNRDSTLTFEVEEGDEHFVPDDYHQ